MSRRKRIAMRLAGVLVCGAVATAAQAQEPTAELDCIERAKDQTVLGEEERERLCLGTQGREPIECFRAALDEPTLDKPEAIDLCRCAQSTEPVDCFREALRVRPSDPLWA